MDHIILKDGELRWDQFDVADGDTVGRTDLGPPF